MCFVIAYNKALEDALAVLDKIAMDIDVKDRKLNLDIRCCSYSISKPDKRLLLQYISSRTITVFSSSKLM